MVKKSWSPYPLQTCVKVFVLIRLSLTADHESSKCISLFSKKVRGRKFCDKTVGVLSLNENLNHDNFSEILNFKFSHPASRQV